MKAALFFALIFFVSCDEVIRPFTNAFLYNVAGKTLPDQCMDSTFDGYMKTLKEQADAQQTTSALVTMINIANHVNSSCPVSDFKEIFDKIAAKIQDPSFITELIAHGIDSLDILIREHNNKEKTPASVGTAIGKAIYPFIKSNNLKRQRKALSSNELSDEIWAVIDGITEGLADGEEFKCKTAVQENREKIGELIEQIKQMIDEGKGIMEIISAIFADLRSLGDFFVDCRILELIAVIKDLTTDAGVQQILIRISDHLPELLSDIAEMVIAITESNLEMAGKYIGEILKIILDFYVF